MAAAATATRKEGGTAATTLARARRPELLPPTPKGKAASTLREWDDRMMGFSGWAKQPGESSPLPRLQIISFSVKKIGLLNGWLGRALGARLTGDAL